MNKIFKVILAVTFIKVISTSALADDPALVGDAVSYSSLGKTSDGKIEMAIYWFAVGKEPRRYTIWTILRNVSGDLCCVPTGGFTPNDATSSKISYEYYVVEPIEGVQLKPSVAELKTVSLKPGEFTALPLFEYENKSERDPENFVVSFYIDPELDRFYPEIWTGNMSIVLKNPLFEAAEGEKAAVEK